MVKKNQIEYLISKENIKETSKKHSNYQSKKINGQKKGNNSTSKSRII